MVQVGQVRAVYWPGDERLATSLAEYADGTHDCRLGRERRLSRAAIRLCCA